MPKLNSLNDTIAAISTPIGQAGIGIVRISGKEAFDIADKIFLSAKVKGESRKNNKPSRFKAYTINYGWIRNNSKVKSKNSKSKSSNGIIDEVLLSVMRKPWTYTKEDVVEINCHSGIVSLRRILDLVLKSGARLAEPGEFTKRAYLNGRIDLTQAEAVLDVIQAKTEAALSLGVSQLKGRVSFGINNIREVLLDILANLEASIDFPEEDIQTSSIRHTIKQILLVEKKLKVLLDTSSKGKILREGIRVVITGRPNVGKSSLLNALLEEERAIVTSIPGTTRDTIEEVINLGGIPLRFIDTAGIVQTRGLIEKEAVKKSREKIGTAELVLLILDGSKDITREDKVFIKELRKKIKIVVINKIDLPQKINISRLRSLGLKEKVVKISALRRKGLAGLEDAIVKRVWPSRLTGSEEIIVSNARHIDLLRKSFDSLTKAKIVADSGFFPELISFEIKEAIEYLDAIVGRKLEEDLLDKIFSEFCIGK